MMPFVLRDVRVPFSLFADPSGRPFPSNGRRYGGHLPRPRIDRTVLRNGETIDTTLPQNGQPDRLTQGSG